MGNWDEFIIKLWGDELPKKTVMCNGNGCLNCKYKDCDRHTGACKECHTWDFKWEPDGRKFVRENDDKNCDNCTHEDKFRDEYPCNNCDGLSEWELKPKTCENCKHEDSSPFDELEKELSADNDVREGYEEIIRAISEQNEEYETKILELTEANKHLAELLDIANERIEIYKNIKDILEERVKNAEKIIEYHKRTNNNSNAMTDAAVALLKAAGYEVTYVGD